MDNRIIEKIFIFTLITLCVGCVISAKLFGASTNNYLYSLILFGMIAYLVFFKGLLFKIFKNPKQRYDIKLGVYLVIIFLYLSLVIGIENSCWVQVILSLGLLVISMYIGYFKIKRSREQNKVGG